MLTPSHDKSSQYSHCLPQLWILTQGLAQRHCVRYTVAAARSPIQEKPHLLGGEWTSAGLRDGLSPSASGL